MTVRQTIILLLLKQQSDALRRHYKSTNARCIVDLFRTSFTAMEKLTNDNELSRVHVIFLAGVNSGSRYAGISYYQTRFLTVDTPIKVTWLLEHAAALNNMVASNWPHGPIKEIRRLSGRTCECCNFCSSHHDSVLYKRLNNITKYSWQIIHWEIIISFISPPQGVQK